MRATATGSNAAGGTSTGPWRAYDVSATGISGKRRPPSRTTGRFSPISTVPPLVKVVVLCQWTRGAESSWCGEQRTEGEGCRCYFRYLWSTI